MTGTEYYHEIKKHAGRDFPFNIYPCTIPLDFRQVPVHWHEEMELIAVKKGRGTVTADLIPYEVKAGGDRGGLSGPAAWNRSAGRGGDGV